MSDLHIAVFGRKPTASVHMMNLIYQNNQDSMLPLYFAPASLLELWNYIRLRTCWKENECLSHKLNNCNQL